MADVERGQKNEGRAAATVETPGLLKTKRAVTQDEPLAHKNSGTKQTVVLSCLVSAHE